ncbi:MAG TPA: hypothetical protein DCG51_06200 [Erysipelotrichaceae bacterium]|nr:hypothetical protein [Erysipelotrichaceae bacterium]
MLQQLPFFVSGNNAVKTFDLQYDDQYVDKYVHEESFLPNYTDIGLLYACIMPVMVTDPAEQATVMYGSLNFRTVHIQYDQKDKNIQQN